MIGYLIEVSIGWALFYGLYHLVLRQLTFFALNRWYLLGTFVAALLLPLAPPIWGPPASPEQVISEAIPLELLLLYLDQPGPVEAAQPVGYSINWWMVVYWIGVGIMGLRFLTGMMQIARHFLQGKQLKKEFYYLVLTRKIHQPFSFLFWIFWGRQLSLDDPDARHILKHEEAHIRQGHTLDVLIMGMIAILAWCSPPVYLYRRALKNNHEYLADAAVVQEYRLKEYGHLLIRQSLSGPKIALANHFFHSKLKKRIIMMTKKRSSRLGLLRYALVLPLSALLVMAYTYEEPYELDELPIFTGEMPALLIINEEETVDNQPAPDEYLSEGKPDLEKVIKEEFHGLPELAPRMAKKLVIKPVRTAPTDTIKPQPLMVLDGAVVSKAVVNDLSPDKIDNIHVLKGEEAYRKYGDKGINGVIEVYTKDWSKKDQKSSSEVDQPATGGKEPLFFLNEEEVNENIINEEDKSEERRQELLEPVFDKINPADGSRVQIYQSQDDPDDKTEFRVKNDNGDSQTGEILRKVDKMPAFEGCDDRIGEGGYEGCSNKKILEYVAARLRPLVLNSKEKIKKTGVAEFIISKSGHVGQVNIRRSISEEIDREIVKIIQSMPPFTPAKQNGKKVNVWITIPISFNTEIAVAPAGSREAEMAKKQALEKQLSRSTLSLQEFSATPNPTRGLLHLRFKGAQKPTVLRVVDAGGREILREQLNSFNGLYDDYLDLTEAPGGMLLISISQGEQVFNHKVIVQD